MIWLLLGVLTWVALTSLCPRDSVFARPYLAFSFVVYLYYCIGGVWYWMDYRYGFFLGADWLGYREFILKIYYAVYLFNGAMIVLFERSGFFDISRGAHAGMVVVAVRSEKIINIMAVAGFVASFYVISRGSDGLDLEAVHSADPFLLILTQCADSLIPIILYKIFTERSGVEKVVWRFAFVYFFLYAAYVGYRYKILLLVAAPVGALLLSKNISILRKFFVIFSGLIVIFLFTIMTLARKKFGGLDWDAVGTAGPDDLLFGLFAEANILFGLASTFESFGRRVDFVGVTPLIDIFTQWVPRYFYPEKSNYEHLKEIAMGLGNSVEAFASATSQPYFAEYYAMAGWIGLVIGCFCFLFVLLFSAMRIVINYPEESARNAILGLIIVFFGYYYFGRGSIGQISKGYVFIILPLLLFRRNQVIPVR